MLSKQIIEESQKFAKEAVETLKTSVSPYNFVETAKKLLKQIPLLKFSKVNILKLYIFNF